MAKYTRRQQEEQNAYKASQPDQVFDIEGTDLEVALWVSRDRDREARCHLAISRDNGKRACRTLLPEHLPELVELAYQMAIALSEDEEIPLGQQQRNALAQLAAELEELVIYDEDEALADAA